MRGVVISGMLLTASAAQAGVQCDFSQVCPSGQACGDSDLSVTLEPTGQGGQSRIVTNGVSMASMAVRFSAAGGEVRATMFEAPGAGVTVLIVDGGLTHLLTYESGGGDAAYSVQSAEARSIQGYFGTCEGAL